MSKTIPLDPDTPQGREVARRLTTVLADTEQAIAERERRADNERKRAA